MYEEKRSEQNECVQEKPVNSDLQDVESTSKLITKEIRELKTDLEDIMLLLQHGSNTRCEEETKIEPNETPPNRFQEILRLLDLGRGNLTDCGTTIQKIKDLIR